MAIDGCIVPFGLKHQGIALQRKFFVQPTLTGKVRTLWTGVGATLLKDVPFAGLYWSLLEPFKRMLGNSELGNISPHAQASPIATLAATCVKLTLISC